MRTYLYSNDIERALRLVGELLQAEDERIAIVIIGGAALSLSGVTDRTTRDVDVVALAESNDRSQLARPPQPFPDALVRATSAVARDLGLPDGWLNGGPAGQWDLGLPPGFAERIHWRTYAALHVGVADRRDLVFFKLEAAADQPTATNNRHLADLLALQPTVEDLSAAADWVKEKNAGDEYHRIVDRVIEHVLTVRRERHEPA